MHRQCDCSGDVVVEPGEIRRDHQPRFPGSLGQLAVRMHKRGSLRLGAVEREHRLVQLNPAGARGSQRAQAFGVHRQQRVEQIQPVECGSLRLGEQEKRDRSDEHRRCLDAQRLRFPILVDRFRRRELERLAALELRDDVVIVGVEPLRHFHRGDVAASSLTPARHREVRVEVHLAPAARFPFVARRHRADHGAGIEHAVVEREVVRGDVVQPNVALQPPVPLPQLGSGGEELLAAHFAAPVPFGRALQFARSAERWEAQIRGNHHSGSESKGWPAYCEGCRFSRRLTAVD